MSLKARVKGIAKVELAKLLQQHYAVREAEVATRKGSVAIGELSSIYLHGIDLNTDLKPAKKLELPSSEQFRAIVEHMRSSQQPTGQGSADLVEFLAYSGCRISEAIKVRWPDVDKVRGRIWIAPGKNSKARHVPLLDSMRDLLDRIKATRC
jgi:integrase